MKTKKSHNPISKETKQKKVRPATVPLGRFNAWKDCTLDPNAQAQWIEELFDWADQPSSLHMVSFWRSKQIARKTWQEWQIRYPAIGEATETVMDMLGERREYLALFSKDNGVSPEAIFKTLRYYDYAARALWEEERKSREDLARIRTEDDEKPTITVVEMEKFTLTPEEVAGRDHKKTRERGRDTHNEKRRSRKQSSQNVSEYD